MDSEGISVSGMLHDLERESEENCLEILKLDNALPEVKRLSSLCKKDAKYRIDNLKNALDAQESYFRRGLDKILESHEQYVEAKRLHFEKCQIELDVCVKKLSDDLSNRTEANVPDVKERLQRMAAIRESEEYKLIPDVSLMLADFYNHLCKHLRSGDLFYVPLCEADPKNFKLNVEADSTDTKFVIQSLQSPFNFHIQSNMSIQINYYNKDDPNPKEIELQKSKSYTLNDREVCFELSLKKPGRYYVQVYLACRHILNSPAIVFVKEEQITKLLIGPYNEKRVDSTGSEESSVSLRSDSSASPEYLKTNLKFEKINKDFIQQEREFKAPYKVEDKLSKSFSISAPKIRQPTLPRPLKLNKWKTKDELNITPVNKPEVNNNYEIEDSQPSSAPPKDIKKSALCSDLNAVKELIRDNLFNGTEKEEKDNILAVNEDDTLLPNIVLKEEKVPVNLTSKDTVETIHRKMRRPLTKFVLNNTNPRDRLLGPHIRVKLRLRVHVKNIVCVVLLKNSDIVVGCKGDNQIKIFDSSGQLRRNPISPRPLIRPSDMVVLPDGRFAVLDDNGISIFYEDGTFCKSIDLLSGKLYGLAVDRDKNLIALECEGLNTRVLFLNYESGKLSQKIELHDIITKERASRSKCRHLHSRGKKLYIVDTGLDKIFILNVDKYTAYEFGGTGQEPGLFKDPAGISVDYSGNVIIADSRNHRIQVFDKKHHFIAKLQLDRPVKFPYKIFFDGQNMDLYVLNLCDDNLSKFKVVI